MKTLIIGLLALVVGTTAGMIIQKKKSPKGPNGVSVFKEVIRVNELHLIKHIYQDILFIHRKNDTKKSIRAIAIVPSSISAYVNLKEIKIEYKDDSISKIIVPLPVLSDVNYQTDKMEINNVKNFQVHIGKDLYPEVLDYLKQITIKRKEAIKQLAMENGIVDQTKEEAKKYIISLFKGLRLNEPIIEFPKEIEAKDSIQVGDNLIPAVHVDK